MTGLRLRFVAAIGGIVVMTLVLAFAVVYRQTGTELKSQLDTSLRDSVGQLTGFVRQESDGDVTQVLALVKRFARSQPYVDASTLQFAIAPGRGTASTHPELFGDASHDDDESLAEQRTERAEGERLAIPRLGFADQIAPDTGMLRTYEQVVKLRDGTRIYLGAAEPVAGIAKAQHGVRGTYLLAGLLGLALALIGAFVAGGRITAPLRRVAATAAQVDGGDLTPRMHVSRSASREVRVLATAFNHMLDRVTDAFRRQREFVADASHELRTPLTVMSGQLDLLRSASASDASEVARVAPILAREVARMSRLTDDLLTLAQADQGQFLTREQVRLRQFVEELWDGLSLTAERRFEVGPVPDVDLYVDPDRLAQALRNLGRNAIQHTRPGTGLVRIDVERREPAPGGGRRTPSRGDAASLIRFTVSDDGPGIPVAERELIFKRFYRTDPARSRVAGGAGLGLAIVKAVAEAHGGAVAVTDRSPVGTAMSIELPYLHPIRSGADADRHRDTGG